MKNISFFRIFIIVKLSVNVFWQLYFFHKKYKNRWTTSVQVKWETLLKKQAASYKKTALELEGLLIKLGQFLSTRADIMPPVFIQELEDLIDRVPAVPWEETSKVLSEEWNGSIGSMVAKINQVPVASASIGQVYQAELLNGHLAAVKVQRPGIEKIIRTDFKAIKIVIWLAKRFTTFGKQTDLPALYRQMVQVIGEELNFRTELKNGLYFKKRYEDFPDVDVPFYYPDLSTKKVLVMEWVEGARITDINFLKNNRIDRHELAKQLVAVFLEQLLSEGKFHADPHPGNILIKPDGTIVLIDFGMVGEISKEDTAHIRLLVEGIISEDYDLVLDALESLRFLLPNANKKQLKQVIIALINAYTEKDLTAMDDFLMQEMLEDIQKIVKKQPIQLPSEFAFFGRAISTFIGILHILNPNINLLEVGKPLVLSWLQKSETGESSFSGYLIRYFNQSFKPLLTLPRYIQKALEEPRQYREWMSKNEQLKVEQAYLLSRQRDSMLFVIISLLASGSFYFLEKTMGLYISGAFAAISLLYYLYTLRAHSRLIRNHKDTM